MPATVVQLAEGTGKAFTGYLALPKRPIGPALVILQEIFGINANVRAIADGYADAGYIAIAPDLFWRQKPNVELDPGSAEDREQATAFLKGLDVPLAVSDSLTAAAHARSVQGASGKVGAVGYCLGGKLAYLLATHEGIDAAVSYYGVGIQGALDQAPKVQCPLLLHIAAEDALCPPPAQASIKQAMAPLGKQVVIMDYPGVGHAFARRGGSGFDARSASRADGATVSFLASQLGVSA